jgi:hypothetical protein
MKIGRLSNTERKVWKAAETGEWLNLRSGDNDLDAPERWCEWERERDVRAEVITALLIGDGKAASMLVRGVRLQVVRIMGELNLEATSLRCPLALLNCSFEKPINLNETTAVSMDLSGSHVPAIYAKHLQIRGDLFLNDSFNVSDGVDLVGACIDGTLRCEGSQFFNTNGPALNATRITVKGGLYCRNGFKAFGEVNLVGAYIGYALDCMGGSFSSNPDDSHVPALNADRLTVDGDMYCNNGFWAIGEVSLTNAHIKGILKCSRGKFFNPNLDFIKNESKGCIDQTSSDPGIHALDARGLRVDGDMYCNSGFWAIGEINLTGAHIGGNLDCDAGTFINYNRKRDALNAMFLRVDGNMRCAGYFAGEVYLKRTHIGGEFDCKHGKFSNPKGNALNLKRAIVDGPLHMELAQLVGTLVLIDAKTSSYHDNETSQSGFQATSGKYLPKVVQLAAFKRKRSTKPNAKSSDPKKTLQLDGFVYNTIENDLVGNRLKWLRQNENGYSPQIYEQLVAVYHRTGRDGDAKRVLIAKEWQRRAKGKFRDKVWSLVLFLLVGYGYRTSRALVWWIGLLFLGAVLFGYVFASDLASKTAIPPTSQPFLSFLPYFFYTLDLLLPVANLHVHDGWVAYGAAQILSVLFTISGWILAAAIVASLTGILKRDVK